jgi:hypothetical protein
VELLVMIFSFALEGFSHQKRVRVGQTKKQCQEELEVLVLNNNKKKLKRKKIKKTLTKMKIMQILIIL